MHCAGYEYQDVNMHTNLQRTRLVYGLVVLLRRSELTKSQDMHSVDTLSNKLPGKGLLSAR